MGHNLQTLCINLYPALSARFIHCLIDCKAAELASGSTVKEVHICKHCLAMTAHICIKAMSNWN